MRSFLVIGLLVGCSAANGALNGAETQPHCRHTVTINVSSNGAEFDDRDAGARDSGREPAVAFCRDCRIDLSCLFDRTGTSARSEQTGQRTGAINASPQTQVSTGANP